MKCNIIYEIYIYESKGRQERMHLNSRPIQYPPRLDLPCCGAGAAAALTDGFFFFLVFFFRESSGIAANVGAAADGALPPLDPPYRPEYPPPLLS
jgi:hypothetical protein